MDGPNPKSTASIAGHPIHPMLVPFPIAFFVAALVTDIVFLSNGNAGWADASLWLLGAGLVGAALAAVAGAIDFWSEPRIRALNDAWQHMIGNVAIVVLQLVNFYLRYSEGPAIVASAGIVLSAIAVAGLLFTGWKGGELVFRRAVGVDKAPDTIREAELRRRYTNGGDEARPM